MRLHGAQLALEVVPESFGLHRNPLRLLCLHENFFNLLLERCDLIENLKLHLKVVLTIVQHFQLRLRNQKKRIKRQRYLPRTVHGLLPKRKLRLDLLYDFQHLVDPLLVLVALLQRLTVTRNPGQLGVTFHNLLIELLAELHQLQRINNLLGQLVRHLLTDALHLLRDYLLRQPDLLHLHGVLPVVRDVYHNFLDLVGQLLTVPHEIGMLEHGARNCVKRASDQQVVVVETENFVECRLVDKSLVHGN